jgi:hypothetical protein
MRRHPHRCWWRDPTGVVESRSYRVRTVAVLAVLIAADSALKRNACLPRDGSVIQELERVVLLTNGLPVYR